MAAAAVLRVDERHDDLAQHREADVDAGRLLQPLARRAGLPLPFAACQRVAHTHVMTSPCQITEPPTKRRKSLQNMCVPVLFAISTTPCKLANCAAVEGSAQPRWTAHRVANNPTISRRGYGRAPARSTRLSRELSRCVMPDSSVVLHSRMQAKTLWLRLESAFIIVSPTLRFS